MGRLRGRAKDKLFWWVLQPWNKYNHPRGLCDSVWHFGYFFFMPPDVINLAGGWGGKHTHILLHFNVHKKKEDIFVLIFFLIIVYSTSCKTKHEQNFHLPFTVSKIRVLGTQISLSRGSQSSSYLHCSRKKTSEPKEDIKDSCTALFTFASICTKEQIRPITY